MIAATRGVGFEIMHVSGKCEIKKRPLDFPAGYNYLDVGWIWR